MPVRHPQRPHPPVLLIHQQPIKRCSKLNFSVEIRRRKRYAFSFNLFTEEELIIERNSRKQTQSCEFKKMCAVNLVDWKIFQIWWDLQTAKVEDILRQLRHAFTSNTLLCRCFLFGTLPLNYCIAKIFWEMYDKVQAEGTFDKLSGCLWQILEDANFG